MAGAQRIPKNRRNALRAGQVQPVGQKEENWLAGQRMREDAGGQLPLTGIQLQHDQYHANMRRTAEAQRADVPRYSRNYDERSYSPRPRQEGRVTSSERPHREGKSDNEYRLHSRDQRPSPPRYAAEFDRDAYLRMRMSGATAFDHDPRRSSRYDDRAPSRDELSRQSRPTLRRSPEPSGRASDRESHFHQGRAVSPRPHERRSEYPQHPRYEERSSYREGHFQQGRSASPRSRERRSQYPQRSRYEGRAVSPRPRERQSEYPQLPRYEERSSYREGHSQQGMFASPRSPQPRYEDRNVDYERRSRPRCPEAQPDTYTRPSAYGLGQGMSATPPLAYGSRDIPTFGRSRASRPVSPPMVKDRTIASSHYKSLGSMDAQVAEIQAFFREQGYASEKIVEDTADKMIEAVSTEHSNHSDRVDEAPEMVVDKTTKPRVETVNRTAETLDNDQGNNDDDDNVAPVPSPRYTFTATDQLLLDELARLGVTSHRSIEKFWRDVFQYADAEYLDARLTTHEALDVALSAVLYLREIQHSGNSIELVSPAFADEVRLIRQRDNGRTLNRGEVLCHWYSSLKYPSKTTPLLTKLQFGEWPCTHRLLQVAGQQGFEIPEEISRLVLQTTVCACRYHNTVPDAGNVEIAINAAPEDTPESSEVLQDAQEDPEFEEDLFLNWGGEPDAAANVTGGDVHNGATESWNGWQGGQDEDDAVVGAFETAIEDALTTNPKVQGAIQEADNFETARQRATEAALNRKAAKIQEQQANTLAFAQRKTEDVIRNLDFLEETRARLRRDQDDDVNCFATGILLLIDHYCENGDQDIVDVTTRPLHHNGVQLPPLESILAIEPKSKQNKGSSWATGELITFLLEVALASGIPNDQHVETNPGSIHTFAVSRGDNDRKNFERLIAENELAHAEARTGYYPADGITADCTSLHIVWNPVGNHWLQSTFTIDPVKRTGRMILRDSLWNEVGQPGHSVKRARHDLPYLAKLVSQRPDLGWQDIVWGPVEDEVCAKQNNTDDCGFLACDTARRVVLGQDLHLPETHEDRETFGRRLRHEALELILQWVCEIDLGEMWEEDDDFYAENEEDEDVAGAEPGQTSVTADLRCGPCQIEDGLCDGQSPCASCEETGSFCWYHDWTAELEAGRNVRTLICDCLLEGHGSASVHEIADYLAIHLSHLIDVNRDCESLRERVSTIMKCDGSSSTFIPSEETPDTPGNEVYTLASGFGRSLGSDRLYKLCGSTGYTEHVSDDIDLDVALVLSAVRHSSGHKTNDGYQNSVARADALMKGHHARFSKTTTLPTKVETPDALEEKVNTHTKCWMPHVLEPGTSNIPYLHDERKNEHIIAMLKRLHEIAERRKEQLIVLVLFNGIDGLTTENSSWRKVAEEYPWLDIRLTMVVPSKCFRSSYGRWDGPVNQLIWVHLSMAYLAKLYDYDADTELEFHLCKHQDIHLTQLGVDPSSSSCQACLSEHGLLGSEWSWLDGSPDPRKVQDFFCHATIIHLLESIKYLKLDYSIFHTDVAFINPSNSLAVFLTAMRRNSYVLPNLTNMECERCGESSGPFTRGSDSMVSLRCVTDCAPAPDQEQERSTSQVQDAQLEARCEICEIDYQKHHLLVAHQNAQHNGHIKCPEETCHDFGFRTESAANDHRRFVHKGVPRPKHICTLCGYTGQTQQQLTVHTFRVHEGTYECTHADCAGIWFFQTELGLRRHTGGKCHGDEHTCSLCGLECGVKSRLKQHQRQCHEGPYRCTQYGCEGSLAFRTELALVVHLNKMHQTGKYRCSFRGCQQSFTKELHKKKHMESHGNEASKPNSGVIEEPPKKRARVSKKQTATAPTAHQTTTMQHTYGLRERKTQAPAEDAAENDAAEDIADVDDNDSIASIGSAASDGSDELRVALPRKGKRKNR